MKAVSCSWILPRLKFFCEHHHGINTWSQLSLFTWVTSLLLVGTLQHLSVCINASVSMKTQSPMVQYHPSMFLSTASYPQCATEFSLVCLTHSGPNSSRHRAGLVWGLQSMSTDLLAPIIRTYGSTASGTALIICPGVNPVIIVCFGVPLHTLWQLASDIRGCCSSPSTFCQHLTPWCCWCHQRVGQCSAILHFLWLQHGHGPTANQGCLSTTVIWEICTVAAVNASCAALFVSML